MNAGKVSTVLALVLQGTGLYCGRSFAAGATTLVAIGCIQIASDDSRMWHYFATATVGLLSSGATVYRFYSAFEHGCMPSLAKGLGQLSLVIGAGLSVRFVSNIKTAGQFIEELIHMSTNGRGNEKKTPSS